jgi:two-component system NtrC family response regulator
VRYKLKHQRQDLTLPTELLHHFSRYHWPGNVRQLENAMERTVLLASGSEIAFHDLPEFLQAEYQQSAAVVPAVLPDAGLNLGSVEKQLIMQTLRKFGGNQSRAARFLQLSRRTLAYRVEKYGISMDDFAKASKETATEKRIRPIS